MQDHVVAGGLFVVKVGSRVAIVVAAAAAGGKVLLLLLLLVMEELLLLLVAVQGVGGTDYGGIP